jgi:hypothetical protein
MAHSVTPASLVVDGTVEAERKNARVDDRFMRRLSHTLRTALVEFGTDGIPVLKDSFAKLDRSITQENFEADIWKFKALLKGPTTLSDKDLELFFAELYERTAARVDSDVDAVDVPPQVDLAETLVYMRRAFGHATAQFHTILKKVRAKKPDFASSPFNVAAQPSQLKVYEYLVSPPVNATQSEAFWLLEQCQRSDFAGELDVDYMVNCLFAFPLPDDIAYPLLLNKLTECVADGMREVNGTSGMRRVLQRVLAGAATYSEPAAEKAQSIAAISPTPKARAHGRFVQHDGAPGQSGQEDALIGDPGRVSGKLDAAQFRTFCLAFGAGLSATEADVLFQFITPTSAKLIDAEEFVEIVRKRLPVVSRHDVVRIAADVRSVVVARSNSGLCDLHLALATVSSEKEIPLGAYCATLRRAGVIPAVVADIDLEHLHREAPTCVELILLLRGNLPASRESVLRKLFSRLEENEASGVVSRERVLSCFEPERADPKVCTHAMERKEALAQYIRTLPANDAYMGYAEFSYFWGNVSVGIPEDAPFVMLLWQAYGMQRDGTRLVPQSASRRRSTRGDSPPSVKRHTNPPVSTPPPKIVAGSPEPAASVPWANAVPNRAENPRPSRRRAVGYVQ